MSTINIKSINSKMKNVQSHIGHGARDFGQELTSHLSAKAIRQDVGSALKSSKTDARPLAISIISIVGLIIYGLGLVSVFIDWNDQIITTSATFQTLYGVFLGISLLGFLLVFKMKKLGVYLFVLSQLAIIVLQLTFPAFDVWLSLMFIAFTSIFLYYFNQMD